MTLDYTTITRYKTPIYDIRQHNKNTIQDTNNTSITQWKTQEQGNNLKKKSN